MWHICPYGTEHELTMQRRVQFAEARYKQGNYALGTNKIAVGVARRELQDASYQLRIFTEFVERLQMQSRGESVVFGLRKLQMLKAGQRPKAREYECLHRLPDGYESICQFKLDYECGKLDFKIREFAHTNIYYSALRHISIIKNILQRVEPFKKLTGISIEWQDVDLGDVILKQIPHLVITPSQVTKVRYNCFEVRDAPRPPNVDGMELAEGQATMREYIASLEELQMRKLTWFLHQSFKTKLSKHNSLEEGLYVHVSPALCGLYDNTDGDAQERAADEYAEWLMRTASRSPIDYIKESGLIFKKRDMCSIIPALKITVEKHSGRWGVKIPYTDLPYLYYAFGLQFENALEMRQIFSRECLASQFSRSRRQV